MELIKLSASYNLKDVKDTLHTEGKVNVETNGTIHIDINTNANSEVSDETYLWGSANYTQQEDGKVNVYFNLPNNYRADYIDYCEQLFHEILENIKQAN